MKAVHFGAGNIGRGFIGILLKKSNYNITFVDVNDDIIEKLKADKAYTIFYKNKEQTSDVVAGVNALHGSKDVDQVLECLATSDLITTSLGQDNLKYICDNVVNSIKFRKDVGSAQKVDIVACENGIQVSSFFKGLIYEKLTEVEQEYADQYIGFVDCTVDRIVPNQHNENICDVQVEPHFEWVLNASQVKVNSNIDDAKYSDDLAYYNKRKLLTVNLTHSLIGYIGYSQDKAYVHQTINQPEVEEFVTKVLIDIRNSLVIEFGIDSQTQDDYAQKTISRFKNELIVDEVERVARNPKIKLGNNERYVSPVKVLLENSMDATYICEAIAYALSYNNPEEKQALEIQELIKTNGIEKAAIEITGLTDTNAVAIIVNKYNQINN